MPRCVDDATNDAPRLLGAFGALSLALLATRLYASPVVGFGDSEALYASYALYPAPAYLDHPGLIGALARMLGDGLAPTPTAAHVFTSVAATLAPWLVYLGGRALGGAKRSALRAALGVTVVPEVAIGLFGLTPDLPLFYAWTLTLILFGRALLATPRGLPAAVLFLGSGLSLGLACSAKVSALTLALALVATLTQPAARGHARTVWPWLALALAGVVFLPVLAFEARSGWPMLRHRLVDTQHAARVSLRNGFAVVFGQAAYLSPLLALTTLALARELWGRRRQDVRHVLFAMALVVPLALLGALCLWSRVAEPHWLAPAWLPIPLYFACRTPSASGSRFTRAPFTRYGVACAALLSACVYAWVLAPSLVAAVPAPLYEPRVDIANELYGWPDIAADVLQTTAAARVPLMDQTDVVVVGPVWMVAAQLRAALPKAIPVGCVGPNSADFATWNPEARWRRAETVVFVHDNRAPTDSAALFPERVRVASHTHTVLRGGKTARTFTIEVLSRRATG